MEEREMEDRSTDITICHRNLVPPPLVVPIGARCDAQVSRARKASPSKY
jgi:hypothetical protein